MKDSAKSMDIVSCSLDCNNKVVTQSKLSGNYKVVARDKYGNIKWIDDGNNLIVNTGLDLTLESTLGGGTPITTWFLGLKNTGVPVAGDTMASHASWTENTAYSDATRVACVFGATSGQSISNSASPAVFNINGATTVDGIFLTSDSTKGGVIGTLFSVRDFTIPRSGLQNGDTLTITFTATQASA